MAVNPDIVHERLVLMREMLEALKLIEPITYERIENDIIVRLTSERIFTQLVELAVSINNHVIAQSGSIIPKAYRDTFSKAASLGLIQTDLALKLAPSAGLRNMLIHDYLKVDRERYAEFVPVAGELYAQYLSEVLAFLSSLDEPSAT